ncbi:MAG: hypothetical protein JXA42_03635 [Anaerolineales bacterium]|nr:hypothetical protein [Anaerolineales bacterium]
MILAWITSHREMIDRWAGRIGWVGLGIETILWLILARLPTDNLFLLALIGIILVPGLCLCSIFLIIRYRQLFNEWYGLALLVFALTLMNWGRGLENLSGLFLLGIIGVIAALPASMSLVLQRSKRSIEFICLVLIIFLWGSLLIAVPYGGPIRAWLTYVTNPETGQFWWLETLICLLILGVPVGGLTFLVHFIHLVVKEIRGE